MNSGSWGGVWCYIVGISLPTSLADLRTTYLIAMIDMKHLVTSRISKHSDKHYSVNCDAWNSEILFIRSGDNLVSSGSVVPIINFPKCTLYPLVGGGTL